MWETNGQAAAPLAASQKQALVTNKDRIMTLDDEALATLPPRARSRKQAEARRVIDREFTFKCCAVCGLQIETCLQVAHLDQNALNNSPDNLARLCPTHHWMLDCGLYPVEAIRILQAHWQVTRGQGDHKARMKDAGKKAARARMWSAAGRKAAVTRARNAAARATADPTAGV
jgi:hypothetical protein